MTLNVRITGGKELNRTLRSMAPRTERNLAFRALRKGGRIIVKDARRRVSKRSRTLERSLGTKNARGFKRAILQVGARSGRQQKYDGWYAHLVEFGTVHSRPKPFLRPSLDANRDKVIHTIGTAIFDEIVKEFAKR